MANSTRTQLSTDSLSLFPDNNSQLITPQDLRDWLTNGIESFVTQKDKSTFENAFYENRSTALASGATVNLSSANGNFVHITGTTNISSFGSASAGSRFILCFDGVLTLTYNATSLILPGSANITTAAGDCCLIISEGSANWRVVAYFPISGGGGGGSGTVTSISTSSPITGGPITTTGTIGIQDAVADGTTKGAASFNASDFNSASGNISIDYANGQKASGSQDGFLSSTDWTTFNGKQAAGNYITALTGDVTASGPGSVAATIANGAVDIPMLSATGTPSATTFLRGDNKWETPSGTGTVTTTGSPTNNQMTKFSGATSITNATAGTDFVAPGEATGSGLTMATSRLLGRTTASTGAIEEISLTTTGTSGAATLSGGVLNIPIYPGASGSLTLGTTIIGGATAGRLLLTTTSGANQVLNQDSNLNYDTTNDRLGIGVASPAARLDLASPVAANPSLILAPSSGVTPTGTTNGSIWCDTTSSNTSLTMRKDSAYTKILTLDRNPDFATSGSGVVLSDSAGTLSKGADITALGIYAQTNSITAITTGSGSLIGTVVGSTTLPTNFFGVGKTIETKFSGLITMPNGSPICTIDFRVTDGTTTSTLGSLVYDGSNMSSKAYIASTQLTCRTTGAGATFGISGQMIVNHAPRSQETVFITPGSVSISGLLTTASALTLQVVVTWTGTAGGSIDTRTHFCNYIN